MPPRARPNAADYGIPWDWVPVPGELSRHKLISTFSDRERLQLYNIDVVYHQQLETLKCLDCLAKGQDALQRKLNNVLLYLQKVRENGMVMTGRSGNNGEEQKMARCSFQSDSTNSANIDCRMCMDIFYHLPKIRFDPRSRCQHSDSKVKVSSIGRPDAETPLPKYALFNSSQNTQDLEYRTRRRSKSANKAKAFGTSVSENTICNQDPTASTCFEKFYISASYLTLGNSVRTSTKDYSLELHLRPQARARVVIRALSPNRIIFDVCPSQIEILDPLGSSRQCQIHTSEGITSWLMYFNGQGKCENFENLVKAARQNG